MSHGNQFRMSSSAGKNYFKVFRLVDKRFFYFGNLNHAQIYANIKFVENNKLIFTAGNGFFRKLPAAAGFFVVINIDIMRIYNSV
jgi:hypothetical protein